VDVTLGGISLHLGTDSGGSGSSGQTETPPPPTSGTGVDVTLGGISLHLGSDSGGSGSSGQTETPTLPLPDSGSVGVGITLGGDSGSSGSETSGQTHTPPPSTSGSDAGGSGDVHRPLVPPPISGGVNLDIPDISFAIDPQANATPSSILPVSVQGWTSTTAPASTLAVLTPAEMGPEADSTLGLPVLQAETLAALAEAGPTTTPLTTSTQAPVSGSVGRETGPTSSSAGGVSEPAPLGLSLLPENESTSPTGSLASQGADRQAGQLASFLFEMPSGLVQTPFGGTLNLDEERLADLLLQVATLKTPAIQEGYVPGGSLDQAEDDSALSAANLNGSDLLSELFSINAPSFEYAFQQLLDQFGDLGSALGNLFAGREWLLWLGAGTVLVAACEVRRRQSWAEGTEVTPWWLAGLAGCLPPEGV